MSDGALAGVWVAVFLGGVGVCVLLAARGMPRTLVRDVLHVGAGLWPLGWPAWQGRAVPIALAAIGCGALLAVPMLARWSRWARTFVASVSGDDERWSGLALYGVAALLLTVLGFWRGAFPAAAGLLALALGDGLGGLVGRRWGRVRYRVPWAKPKTLEGSLAVALFSAVGIAPLVAAVTESLSPRSLDNLTVPLAVWALYW